jgi:hypothetical protein
MRGELNQKGDSSLRTGRLPEQYMGLGKHDHFMVTIVITQMNVMNLYMHETNEIFYAACDAREKNRPWA